MSKAWLNFVFLALICASAIGQNNFKVLHSFSGYPNDGAASISAVAFGNNGNLYGTTAGGGNGYGCGDNGCGMVFELSPQQDGSWKETVIHNFCTDFDGQACLDGAYPYAGLLADSKGNLYGTTVNGGPSCPPWGFIGCGVLFELSPPAIPGDSWTEAVLYDFCSVVQGIGCLDGELPTGQLIFDPAGNLYGTTTGGGSGHLAAGGGTVFELSPDAGRWKEAILYDFCSLGSGEICPDGYDVTAGVTFDAEGNLYGTTTYSGNEQSPTGGTIYELARLGSVWKYRELLDVPANSKRSVFYGNVSFDSLGDLYSTFSFVYGGVFRMSLGDHKLTILDFNGADGENPVGGVYVNSNKGALYGTTTGGGGANPGNFFEIARDGKETVLHTFCSWTDCEDGELPRPTPVPDKSSNLYGTTQFGGTYGNGVVFEVTP